MVYTLRVYGLETISVLFWLKKYIFCVYLIYFLCIFVD